MYFHKVEVFGFSKSLNFYQTYFYEMLLFYTHSGVYFVHFGGVNILGVHTPTKKKTKLCNWQVHMKKHPLLIILLHV